MSPHPAPAAPSEASPRRICVVGSLNMDLVVRAPRFPQAGETILGGEFATFPGGKGANQAVAAARMGAKVSMIGRVGDDAYGEQMRAVLEAEGIDTTGVLTTPNTPTGAAVITVAEGGGNTIVVAPGANGKVTPADVEAARDTIEAADVVLMQLEVPMPAVTRAAQLAKAAGRAVLLNAAPAMELPRGLVYLPDLIIVNETEAEIIAATALERELRPIFEDVPSEDVQRVLRRVAGLPVPAVVTLGADGAAWIANANLVMVQSIPVNAIDTVGAGDAFCGGLATTWECRRNLGAEDFAALVLEASRPSRPVEDAAAWVHKHAADPFIRACGQIRQACVAGALATTKPGAIPSLPRLADVRAFIEAHAVRKT